MLRGPSTEEAIDSGARSIAIATAALAAAVHGGLVFGAVDAMFHLDSADGAGSDDPLALAGAITSGALAIWIAARALRSATPSAAVLARSLVGGIATVPLTFAICLLPFAFERFHPLAFLAGGGALVIASIVVSPITAIFGLVFGVVLERLLAPVREELGDPDLGVPERVAMRCGAWLVITGVFALLFAGIGETSLGLAGSSVMLALGMTFMLMGALRRVSRLAFLARVASDREPGWAIVPLSSLGDSTSVLRFDRGPRGDRALVQLETAGDGAYRASSHARPWAVLSRTAQPDCVDLLAETSR